jgi:dimethylglycine catabolism B
MANNLATGNNLAISREEYLEGMRDLGADLAEECPGFYVPVDKQGADILFFPNSKEVYGDFEDQFWWWKIFYAARENWTVPSEGWEAVDWALFTGNYDANRELARRKIEYMRSKRHKDHDHAGLRRRLLWLPQGHERAGGRESGQCRGFCLSL